MASIDSEDDSNYLTEENKKLSKELLFANQCLSVLIEFKAWIDCVFQSNHLDHHLNTGQRIRYKDLNKKVFQVFSRKGENLNFDSPRLKSESLDHNSESIGEDVNEDTLPDRNVGDDAIDIKPNDVQNNSNDSLSFGSELIRQKLAQECVPNSSESDLRADGNRNGNLVCDQIGCQFQTKNPITLKHHKLLNHSKKFICHYSGCEFKTCTKYNLVRHHKIHERKANVGEQTTSQTTDDNQQTTISDQIKQQFKSINQTKPPDKSYVCNYPGCKFRAAIKKHLAKHKQTHPKTEFACHYPQCQYRSHQRHYLMSHLKTHQWIASAEEAPVMAPPENRPKSPVVSKEVVDKRKWGKPWQFCDWVGCNFQTNRPKHFEGHMNLHKGLKPHKCEHCEECFASEVRLQKHFLWKHKKSDQELVCRIDGCGRRFETNRAFVDHQNYHFTKHRYICDFPQCNYRTNARATLVSHRAVHGMERPIKCIVDGCPKTFAFESQLRHHMASHTAPEERNHRCTYEACGKVFSSPSRVVRHVQMVHDVKRFECDWPGCGYRSGCRAITERHMEVHSTQCNYVCPNEDCQKRFKSRTNLDKHRLSHSTDTPFACPWPGCLYAGKTKKLLRAHMLVHKAEHLIPCEWEGCDKQFKKRTYMRLHMRTHTNDKRYVCPQPGCDFRCCTNSNLTAHIQRNHKK